MLAGYFPMYTPLEDLPTNVIIDANCVLNAALAADSPSSRAVSALREIGYTPLVVTKTLDETRAVLDRIQSGLELTYDPQMLIESWIRQASIMCIPGVHQPGPAEINRIDRYLVAAALAVDAWIMTLDVPLFYQCAEVGLDVRFPHDVIVHSEVLSGNERAILNNLIDYYPLGPDEGFIFSRITPDIWQPFNGRRFTVAQIDRIGWLGFDGSQECWIFEYEGGGKVRVDDKPLPGEAITILVNIKAGEYIELRTSKAAHPSIYHSDKFGKIPHPGGMHVGSTSGKVDFLNGVIARLVTGPSIVGTDRWKYLRSPSNAAPNPWSESLLRRALSRIIVFQASDGTVKVHLPTVGGFKIAPPFMGI